MKTHSSLPHFKTIALLDVPRSRDGKHKKIVTSILSDLDQLGENAAFKVPLSALGDTKENVRSALNRATRKSHRVVATATDDQFLYVWNVTKADPSVETRPLNQGKITKNTRQG